MKLALIILMLPALAAAQGVEYTDAQVYNHYRSNLGSSAYYIGFEVASLCMLVPECKAKALRAASTHPTFGLGDKVTKKSGSHWTGKVVGFYSTKLTPEGYAVESSTEMGSVQIYPAGALELM